MAESTDLPKPRPTEHELLSREIFRTFVDAVNDYAIFALDPEGRILTWNSGAARLKGYTAAEAIGSHFSRFYTEPDLARNHPRWEIAQALKNGSYEEEGWRVRKDGTRFWANVIITTVRDATGRHLGFSKVTRDLTERKAAEDRLREANASLERRVQERTTELEKAIQSREDFFSIASHELRSPLTALRLKIQLTRRLLARETTPDPKFVKFAEDTDDQVHRLVKLVDDMLDLGRISQGRLPVEIARHELGEILRATVDRLAIQFRERSTPLTLEIENGPIPIDADRLRIEQVLQNLLTNTLRYAPGKPVEVRARIVGDRAEFRVQDHGPGIPVEHHEQVFERYERLKPSASAAGLGIGLFLARSIVETHHGKIRLESPPGEGACFIVELPLAGA